MARCWSLSGSLALGWVLIPTAWIGVLLADGAVLLLDDVLHLSIDRHLAALGLRLRLSVVRA